MGVIATPTADRVHLSRRNMTVTWKRRGNLDRRLQFPLCHWVVRWRSRFGLDLTSGCHVKAWIFAILIMTIGNQ
jgi:hypothetical protein